MYKNVYIFLLSYLWDNNNSKIRLFFLGSVIVLIIAKLIGVFVPLFFKFAIDALNIGSFNNAVYMLTMYGAVRIVGQLFNEVKEALFVITEQNAIKKISTDLFRHLHTLKINFYITRPIGSIIYCIERGIKSIETILKFASFNIVPTIFEIAFVCAILFSTYNIIYASMVFCTVALYVTYTICITNWRSKEVSSTKKIDSNSISRAVDSIVNYETVKYFNNEDFEEKNYEKLVDVYKKSAIKNKISLSMLNIGQATIIALGITTCCIFAAHDFFISKLLTIGDIILLNTYLLQIYQPLSNLGFSYREIRLSKVDAIKVMELMNEPCESENNDKLKFKYKEGKIEFREVCFSYEGDHIRDVLKNISFVIEPKKTTAIVGKSGAGKSTISKLLFSFYLPSSGSIFIDDQDIKLIDTKSLRAIIGIVPQNVALFHDTIYYNIAYGNTANASLEDVKKASELASLNELINNLPDGYDTIVGERGLKLSGGERQRVSIARALMKNPKIFIFDEATSSLDVKTEKIIQQSINDISKNHTTIIIAHRLSTIKNADMILVLEDGKIIASGTHNDLIKDKNSTYYEMWNNQKNIKSNN